MAAYDDYPIRDILISSIRSDGRIQGANPEATIKLLTDSIGRHGLLQPVVVCQQPSKPGYLVISGRKRLRAMENLGWTHTPAVIVPDEAHTRIGVVVENLHRAELTASERARNLAEYKEWLESTKQAMTKAEREAAGAKQTHVKLGRKDGSDNLSDPSSPEVKPSAAAIAATETGVDERTVRRDIAIGEVLTPEAEAVVQGTPVNNRFQLDGITKPTQKAKQKVDIAEGARLKAEKRAEEFEKQQKEARAAAARAEARAAEQRKQEALAEMERAKAEQAARAQAAINQAAADKKARDEERQRERDQKAEVATLPTAADPPKADVVQMPSYDLEGVAPGHERLRCQLHHSDDPRPLDQSLTIQGKAIDCWRPLAKHFDKVGMEILLVNLFQSLANANARRVLNTIATDVRRRGGKLDVDL